MKESEDLKKAIANLQKEIRRAQVLLRKLKEEEQKGE